MRAAAAAVILPDDGMRVVAASVVLPDELWLRALGLLESDDEAAAAAACAGLRDGVEAIVRARLARLRALRPEIRARLCALEEVECHRFSPLRRVLPGCQAAFLSFRDARELAHLAVVWARERELGAHARANASFTRRFREATRTARRARALVREGIAAPPGLAEPGLEETVARRALSVWIAHEPAALRGLDAIARAAELVEEFARLVRRTRRASARAARRDAADEHRRAKDACDSLSAHEDRMFANMLPILLLQHGPTSYWEREAR